MIEKIRNIDGLSEGRLSFRKMNQSDIDALIPYFKDEDSLKFRKKTNQSPQEMAEEWFEAIQTRYENDWDGLYIIQFNHSSDIAGLAGILHQVVDDEYLFEIGYHILPEFRQRHIASEAAQILSKCIEENKIAPFVVSIIHEDNNLSKNVASNNGMSLWKKTDFRGTHVEVWRKDFDEI